MSILNEEDKPIGASKLRGADRSSAAQNVSGNAWVDAKLMAWCSARAAMKARGRRQVVTPVPADLVKPWRGLQTVGSHVRAEATAEARAYHPSKQARLFECEESGKGTADANGASRVGRDPRPDDGSSRGSSGGQATNRSKDRSNTASLDAARIESRVSGFAAQNPRNGAERRDASRQIASGAKRQSRQNGRDANSRGWDPGARVVRESGLSFGERTLRAIGDVEGDKNPMRGGVHIGRSRGEKRTLDEYRLPAGHVLKENGRKRADNHSRSNERGNTFARQPAETSTSRPAPNR